MGRRKPVKNIRIEREKNIARANRRGPFSKKLSLVIYAVVLVLAVAARTLQLKDNMNFDTGRYYDDSLAKNYPLMVLIPGLILIALVLITGSSKDKVIESCILINPMRLRYDRLNKKIPSAAGYSCVLMALLVLAEIAFDFIDIVHKNSGIAANLPPKEAKNYNMLTGYSWGLFFLHFLMLLVILTFISIAVNIFKKEGLSHANCAALSTFALWKCVEIAGMVSQNSVVAASSEMVYTMFTDMLAVLFFLTVARFFNGMEKKTTRFWMCFLGYAASIFASVSVIPRYIMLLIPRAYEDRIDVSIPSASDVGIIFITITIVAVFWSTYVYRVMPKLNVGKRRWGKAPISRKFNDMDTIDVIETSTEK